MRILQYLRENRILFSILLPVLGGGLFISIAAIEYAAPRLFSLTRDSSDTNIRMACEIGLAVCEERLSRLVERGHEEEPGLVAGARSRTIEDVTRVSRRFHHIHILVTDSSGKILANSRKIDTTRVPLEALRSAPREVVKQRWGELTVMASADYFPGWGWHVVSYMTERRYLEPMAFINRVISLTAFGILAAIAVTSFLTFSLLLNRPLKRIIRAARAVAEGRFVRTNVSSTGEIGKLAKAFDAMVEDLELQDRRIRAVFDALMDSEEQYRLVTENSLATILMVREGKIFFANARAASESGLPWERIIGTDIGEFVHPEDRIWVRECFGRLSSGETEVGHFECRQRVGERLRWLELLAVPVSYRGSRAVLAHALDVTERRESQQERLKLQAELLQAQKMEAVGTLAGGISHDFNNLLQSIRGHAELIALRYGRGEDSGSEVEAIVRAADRGERLVRQLLTFSKKVEPEPQLLELNRHIMECVDLLRRTLPKMIRIEVDLAEGLLPIQADPVQIEQVLVNLALNARDAMPDGGELVIRTRNEPFVGDGTAEGPGVVVEVSDTGHGMDEHVCAHMFEPFFTTKGPDRGTGLGLAIVYGIVTHHCGTITCDSDPSRGSTFRMSLPAGGELREDRASVVEPEAVGGAETILLVDDEEPIRELGENLLSMYGYKVLVAANGREALETYGSDGGTIDLVILDLVMPEMEGAKCLAEILMMNPLAKVIIASGTPPEVSDATPLDQAKGFLRKPYKLQELLTTIRTVLDDGHEAGHSLSGDEKSSAAAMLMNERSGAGPRCPDSGQQGPRDPVE
jgi:PAS domain S-box-containing protein